MDALECRDLRCEFEGIQALDGVSLSLGAGEFVGLIGPNAAGKTTLLNAINGLSSLRSGTIKIYSADISGMSIEERAKVGVVRSFEAGGVCERLTAVDNVVLGLCKGSLDARRQSARRWLLEVGLGDARELPGGVLSVGQRRRLGVAQVLARVEELDGRCVVLLDEPFGSVDLEGREIIMRLLRDHIVRRVPALMVEHNRKMVDALATRVVRLEHGRLAETTSEPPEHVAEGARAIAGSEVLLLLKDVRAGYGSAQVLHGVSLEVRAGEIVRLVGGNGAGKSTLLRAVMGTLRPTAGTVLVFGQVLGDCVSRPLFGVGYAPQGGRLIGDLTVSDHLEMARNVATRRSALPNLGRSFFESFPELSPLLSKPTSDLSTGQRSLVSLATTFATEPRLLVADEPVAGLSPALVERLWSFLLRTWCSPERATLLVEHRDRLGLAARTVRLDRGTITEEGRRR